MTAKLQLLYPAVLKLFGTHAVKQRSESRQFLAWFLEHFYRLEGSEIDDCICDGNYDKGIDGVYVNEQLARIDVFQSRIVKGDKTQGDVGLKEFRGTLSQFQNESSVKNMLRTTKNLELAGLLRATRSGRRIDETRSQAETARIACRIGCQY